MNFEANISRPTPPPPMEAYKEYLDRRGGGGGVNGFSIESLLSPPHTESPLAAAAASPRYSFYVTRLTSCAEMGYKVGLRLRELAPRGKREPGGKIHAT